MSAGSAGSGSSRGRSRAGFSTTAILVVVFGAVIVSQLAALVILGAEASAPPTVTQNCQLNFWVFHAFCGDTSTANANAYAAGQLASSLTLPFIVIDVIFASLIAFIAFSGRKDGSGKQSGRQIGASSRGGARRGR